MTTYTVGQVLSLSIVYRGTDSSVITPYLTTQWVSSNTASAAVGSTGLQTATANLVAPANGVTITTTDPTSGFTSSVTFNVNANATPGVIRSGRINIFNPNVFVGQGSNLSVQFYDGPYDENGNPTGIVINPSVAALWRVVPPVEGGDAIAAIGSTGIQSAFVTAITDGLAVLVASDPVSGFTVTAEMPISPLPDDLLTPFYYVDKYIQDERQLNPLWVTQTYLCNWSTE